MSKPYSMVIIDDIRTVIQVITKKDWSGHGLEIVGTASNGEEGLALIKASRPDIIVTDIRMPKLSGLDMVKEILEFVPHSKIIYISGYSDFDYTQTAIRLGAFDYLLKPFTPGQLSDVLQKAVRVLEEERAQSRQLRDLERKVKESMPLLRQEYLNSLVRYPASREAVRKRWDFLGIALDTSCYSLLAFEIDGFEAENRQLPIAEVELLRFAVQNILEDSVFGCTEGVLFRDGASRFAAIVHTPPEIDAVRLAETCCENVARYSKSTVSAGISLPRAELTELPAAYREAMEALSYTFYTEGGSVFAYNRVIPITAPRFSGEKEKELLYGIRSGNSAKAMEVLESIFLEWEGVKAKPSPEQVRTFFVELALVIGKSMEDLLQAEEGRQLELMLATLRAPAATLGLLQQTLKEICEYCCGFVQRHFQANATATVNEMIRYIQNNLHLNLSVNDYAKQVHLSASYFANLFKKVTGVPIMQFVTQERMEKAKLLLLEGKSVNEVAEQLGYEERSYFSDVFKKHTGITPKEFRAQYS